MSALIRVSFLDDSHNTAAIHVRPGWIARIFGVAPHDAFVVAIQCVSGGRTWIYDDTGVRVPDGCADALERARTRALHHSRVLSGCLDA